MLLATAEICGIPVGLLLLWAWWAWYQYQKQNPTFTSVTWTNEIYSPLPIDAMQEFYRTFFCNQRSCTLVSRELFKQVFRRGNQTITSMPAPRDVYWHEVPITITLEYSLGDGGRTDVRLLFAAPGEMTFDNTCADFFHKQAEEEHDAAFAALEAALDALQREQHESDDKDAGDSDEDNDDAYKGKYSSNVDFEMLGLRDGASLDQVQAAYREACKKYHPDTLSGHRLPPHLVELAVAKFKEITNAYQRLKQKLG